MRLVLLSILALSLSAFTGSRQEAMLAWSPDKVLTWEDFSGTPDPKNDHHAQAQCLLDAGIFSDGNTIHFKVFAYFLTDQSWTRTNSDYNLLLHEQLHFDIAELHARKLRKKLITLFREDADLSKVFDPTFNEIDAQFHLMQDAYDRETHHGTDKAAQKWWNELIGKSLERYDDYRNPVITMALQ